MAVNWRSEALDELADIYVGEATPPHRERIARTVEAINEQLDANGMFLGESRGGPLQRVWFHHPLVVGYSIPPGGGIVIFHVARLKDNAQNDS